MKIEAKQKKEAARMAARIRKEQRQIQIEQEKNNRKQAKLEAKRIKQLYDGKAEEYQLGWSGSSYVPGDVRLSDTTNKILTSSNAALYAIITSVVCATGYSPHIGFVHSGSPLPFVYDLADLYKEHLCIDFAFKMTKDLAGYYDKKKIIDAFRMRIMEFDLIGRIKPDIDKLFEGL